MCIVDGACCFWDWSVPRGASLLLGSARPRSQYWMRCGQMHARSQGTLETLFRRLFRPEPLGRNCVACHAPSGQEDGRCRLWCSPQRSHRSTMAPKTVRGVAARSSECGSRSGGEGRSPRDSADHGVKGRSGCVCGRMRQMRPRMSEVNREERREHEGPGCNHRRSDCSHRNRQPHGNATPGFHCCPWHRGSQAHRRGVACSHLRGETGYSWRRNRRPFRQRGWHGLPAKPLAGVGNMDDLQSWEIWSSRPRRATGIWRDRGVRKRRRVRDDIVYMRMG